MTRPRRALPARVGAGGALLCVLALAGCTTSGASSTGSKGYVTGDGGVTEIDPSAREAAPSLEGDRLGGGTVSLADLAGKVTVVNVWGSWCSECREETADLVEVANDEPSVGFLGVNIRDETANAEAYVRQEKIPYPSLVSQDSSALLGFYGKLNLNTVPSTIVIDAQGRIAALVRGPVDASTLSSLVDDARTDS